MWAQQPNYILGSGQKLAYMIVARSNPTTKPPERNIRSIGFIQHMQAFAVVGTQKYVSSSSVTA